MIGPMSRTTPEGIEYAERRRTRTRATTSRPFDFTEADVREHLEYVFSGRHGYVHIGTVDRSEGPKPSLGNRKSFQWPAERDALVSTVVTLQQQPWTEVFYCPYPFKTRSRAVNESASRWLVHQDIDHPLRNADRAWLRRWGFRVVSTGTPGHVQVYARLSRSLTLDEHRGLMDALRRRLGGDDKIADNDLLKLPGGYNHKHHTNVPESKRNERRGDVRVEVQGRSRVDADALIAEVSARPMSVKTRESDDWTKVDVPTRLTDAVRAAMERPAVAKGLQSDDLYARVCVVAEAKAKYTRPQIHAILDQCDAGHERYNGRWHHQIDHMLDRWEGHHGTELVQYDPDEQFWDRRPILKHIHTCALASMASPWAVLGVVFTRVFHVVPPRVHLPLLGGGGIKQLNMFVALIGPSGQGKGTAVGAADAAVSVGMTGHTVNIGSGEGIAKAYRERVAGKVNVKNTAVLFDVPEVSTWNNLTGRTGSTLVGEVLKGFSGESLGFQNADDTKTVPVEKDTYRMGLVIGAQPGMCGPLLGNVSSGLPQRFLWMPTWNDDAPDTEPAMPDAWAWEAPYVGSDGVRIELWDGITSYVREQRRAVVRRAVTIDPLDSHAVLLRIRVATALALLDGRMDVTQDDWELSSLVMLISDRTRGDVQFELKEARRRENVVRGTALGEQQTAAATVVEDAAIGSCGKAVVNVLRKVGDWMTASAIRDRLASRHKTHVRVALARLVRDGVVERETMEYHGQTGSQYRVKA